MLLAREAAVVRLVIRDDAGPGSVTDVLGSLKEVLVAPGHRPYWWLTIVSKTAVKVKASRTVETRVRKHRDRSGARRLYEVFEVRVSITGLDACKI